MNKTIIDIMQMMVLTSKATIIKSKATIIKSKTREENAYWEWTV